MAARDPREHPERHWWVWLLLLAIGVVVALGLLYWWQQQEDDEEAGARAVPSVVGLSEQEARDVLEREGFEVEVEDEESEEPSDRVLAQEPEAGTRLEEGGTVTLTVSRGPPETETETVIETETETAEPETAEVPDVVGDDHTDAGDAVADAGFLPETYPVDSPEEAGTVVAQNPDAGTELREGERVRLNVSLGEGERQQAEVPDVTGPDAQDGLETCRDAGFTCRIVERSAPSQEEVGEVIDQRPAAGSTARQLSQITLFVGR
jgi:eukaryotic-like serine/threonine-protein kinase